MKRNFIFLIPALSLSALAGCAVEEMPDKTVTGEGSKLVLTGEAIPQTKVSVGDKEGDTYPGLWEAGDAIGIYSLDVASTLSNVKAVLDDADAHSKTGVFTTVEAVAGIDAGTDLVVYYPYSSGATYSANILSGSVPQAQTQSAPGSSLHIGPNSLAYATTTYAGADQPAEFTLSYATAIVKLVVSTTDLTGYTLNNVSVISSEAPISGDITVNVTDDAIALGSNTNNAISLTLTSPAALSASQELWFTALPGTHGTDGLDLYFNLSDETGATVTKTLTLKGTLMAGTVNVLNVELSAMLPSLDWYYGKDSRLTPGLGYAYGEANTYLIQCKSGSTYTGATYAANDNIPDEVTIDYRYRGDLAYAMANDLSPEGVTFEWFKLSNGTVYTPRTNGYTASGADPTAYTIAQNAADYTVTVKNTGAYAGAPILLMKKSGKILWAWTFWNIAADGTTLDPVTVGTYQLAPMDLGQPTTNADAWTANSNDPMFRMNQLYQWGRPFPIFWTTYWSLDGLVESVPGNVPTVYGKLSLAESLSTVGMIVNNPSETTNHLGNWCTENINNLWGTADAEQEGDKTVYDPCPKGWRVMSTAAVNYIVGNFTPTYIEEGYKYSIQVGDAIFYNNGYVDAKISSPTARPSNMQFAGGQSNRGWIWSNVAGNTSGNVLYWTSSTFQTTPDFKRSTFDKSFVMSVRCMVDEDNR